MAAMLVSSAQLDTLDGTGGQDASSPVWCGAVGSELLLVLCDRNIGEGCTPDAEVFYRVEDGSLAERVGSKGG